MDNVKILFPITPLLFFILLISFEISLISVFNTKETRKKLTVVNE